MAWLADNMTGTVFFAPSGQVDAFQPWVKLFNGSPQQFAQNPLGQPAGSQASGTIGAYQVAIAAQAGRLDLTLNPIPSGGLKPAAISDVNSALTTLMGYFKKILVSQEPTRLALVLNLSKPTPDLAEATVEFNKQTKLNVRKDATDLSFSINIVKSFDGVDSKINRICRWGTGQLQMMTLNVNGFNSPQVPVFATFYATTLQLDINTVPNERIIEPIQSEKVISALVTAAHELIENAYTELLA